MSDADKLFDAIMRGNVETVAELLENQRSLASARNPAGMSTVIVAIYHRQKEALRLLLRAKPTLDIFTAAALGRTREIDRLIKLSPDLIHSWSPDGFSPLHLSSFFGHTEAASLLLKLGADVGAVAKNASKVQPLHSAVAAPKTEIVRLLLEAGADANAQQQGGWTPLHAAVKSENLDMIRCLLERNADPEVDADDGTRPKDLAVDSGNQEVLELIQGGSSPVSQA